VCFPRKVLKEKYHDDNKVVTRSWSELTIVHSRDSFVVPFTTSTMRIRNLLLSVFCLPIFSPANASQDDQMPINTETINADYVPQKHAKPSLADLLTIESSASIFYTYARETELSSRLTDETSRLTVFVPTNKAVIALARKPFVF